MIKEEIKDLSKLDPTTAKVVKEYYDLKQKEKEVKLELSKKMESISRLWKGDSTQKVIDDIIATYVNGGDRLTKKYKEAFLLSLTKVNKNTRDVLENCLEETSKITSFSPSLKFKGDSLEEGLWDKIKDSKFVNMIKSFMVKLKVLLDIKEKSEKDFVQKFSNLSDIMSKQQKLKYGIAENKKKIKISNLIKLVESKIGKKVVLKK